MNKLTTQIIVLILLFLFPSVSFSQTFKCEFIQEKFKGGKSNKSMCTGEPESAYYPIQKERTEYCINFPTQPTNYLDYINFEVDLEKKTVFWSDKFGMENDYRLVGNSNKIISSNVFEESVLVAGDENKFKSTISHLILFHPVIGDNVKSLYIPENGKSIITSYDSYRNTSNSVETSRVILRYGVCEKVGKQNPLTH